MWRKLAVIPLLLIPVASVAFLIQQGFIKVDWLKTPDVPGPPPIVESFKMDSAQTGKSYDINVELPPAYRQSTAPYPVVFAIGDHPHVFEYQKVIDPLIRKSKIPAVIVVGVSPVRVSGGGGGGFGGGGNRLKQSDNWLDDTTRVLQTFGPQRSAGGKSEAFVSFFEKELIPKIEGQYRTVPGERCLAGYDFGAVFVVETGLTHPELFTKYLAVAPLAAYGDSVTVKLAQEKVKAGYDPKVRTYFVVGADEAPVYMNRFQALDEVMKSKRYTNLRYKSEILPNQDHARILVPGTLNGLTFLYGKS